MEKKYIVKFINLVKKYLPDIIIIIGAWILSYNLFRPSEKKGGLGISMPFSTYTDYHTEWKVLGIIILVIGIDIAIRRYIAYKKK